MATAEGNAMLARHHKGHATPKAEFAALMSVAGYATFDEACDLYDASPVEVGALVGAAAPSSSEAEQHG